MMVQCIQFCHDCCCKPCVLISWSC